MKQPRKDALDLALEERFDGGMKPTLPKGVVSAGGANISVPNYSASREAEKAAGHLKYLAGGVNAPPSSLHYEPAEVVERVTRANLITATQKGSRGVLPKEHLNAALAHIGAANALRATGGSVGEVHAHIQQAKEHTEAAGPGLWDESKHPRDEAGKFA